MSKLQWKKAAFGLVTASAALVLAACGNGGEDTASSSASSEPAEGGTLQVSVGPDYVDYVNEIAPAFEEETGIDVEVVEREMFETLDALSLDGPAGIAPDVTIAPYDRIGNLGIQGHLTPVTLPEDDRYDDTDKQQVTANDEVYGMPFVVESLVLYYNKDLIDAAPTTFAELEALSEDSAYDYETEEGKNTAFLANWVDFYSAYGLISGYGGYIFGSEGTDTADIGLNNEGAVEGIEYAKTWYEKWPEGMLDTTSAGSFVDETFIAGDAAAIIGGPWSAASYDEGGVNYGIAPMPELPNGESYQPFGGGKGWIISGYTENAEAAQQWVEYVTTEENQTALHEFNSEVPANQQARQAIVDAGENELAVAVIEQYNNAVPMPNIPEMAEVWTGAETMMFDAVSGNKSAQQSADDAVKVIQDNIAQKY
ncbi:MAG: sugar ABC transporter substrate-binding protein [Aerococcus viridans]|jgi:arabinogalactan oligomer/maltooligosaccharide transport system substrate-binding protein|uniref:Maltodextrin-binding protein n=1 Tax=Aerococcus agrisoli TaxID=2487350 RepID=A0A3N4GBR8_9LACT|nr:extracellular solute-binding protein [Aerococcus agrisoli]OYW73627.1 MAG: sugar ABC transporter substrate-binding protein [Aerococcus viridans]RPA59358.1 extracellular solute-binding protein [Aerococcus agrisoli]